MSDHPPFTRCDVCKDTPAVLSEVGMQLCAECYQDYLAMYDEPEAPHGRDPDDLGASGSGRERDDG